MDFTELEQPERNNWTDVITAIYGSYSWLNDVPIHYFTTSISAMNLHDDVKLMGEIVGVEKWGFEALFQRVVREEWVEKMVNQYLSDENRFKFFPPVTIALLPCEDDTPLRDYDEQKFAFSPSGKGQKCTLKGLELTLPYAQASEFPTFGSPAQLKWDRQKFAALAIDGQHRISALRKFIPRGKQNAIDCDIPATILIFDTKLPKGRDLIQATREIFIDINKNAKTVDTSRLILLDDRNFYNGLTRSLILRAYEDGETPSSISFGKVSDSSNLEIANGIPQELIDSASGKDATDVTKLKDWQFTSAFIINKAIQHFVFENNFKTFEALLDTSDFQSDSEEEFEQRIADTRERLADDEDPITDKDDLNFEPRVAAKIVGRAIQRYRSLLLGCFTGFKPYRDHIERFQAEIEAEDGEKLRSILLSEGSFPKNVQINDFSTKPWKDLDVDEKKKYRTRIQKVFRPSGWDKSIVWYSVFQRGLLYQPLMSKRCLEEARGDAYNSREEFAEDFISGLDWVFDEGLFEKGAAIAGQKIWEGIVLKQGDSGLVMDGGDAAARKCGHLIRLLVAAKKSFDEGNYPEFAKSFGKKKGVKGSFTIVCKGYEKSAKAREAAAGKTPDDEKLETDAKDKLKKILETIGNPQI